MADKVDARRIQPLSCRDSTGHAHVRLLRQSHAVRCAWLRKRCIGGVCLVACCRRGEVLVPLGGDHCGLKGGCCVVRVWHFCRGAGGGGGGPASSVLVGAARAIHNIRCAVRADEANSAILHRPEQRDGGSVCSARCISQLEYRSAPAVDHRDCRGNICSPPRMDIPCLCRAAACHWHISTFRG